MGIKWKKYDSENKVEDYGNMSKDRAKPSLAAPFFSWLSCVCGVSFLIVILLFTVSQTGSYFFNDGFSKNYFMTDVFRQSLYDVVKNTTLEIEHIAETSAVTNGNVIGDLSVSTFLQNSDVTFYYHIGDKGVIYTSLPKEKTPPLNKIETLFSSHNDILPIPDVIEIYVSSRGEFRYFINSIENTLNSDTYQWIRNGLIDNFIVEQRLRDGNEFYLRFFLEDAYPMAGDYAELKAISSAAKAVLIAFLASIILISISLLKGKNRRHFTGIIMSITGWFYSEIKIAVIIFVYSFLFEILQDFRRYNVEFIHYLVVILSLWTLWYLIMDIVVHKNIYLKHSFIVSVFNGLINIVHKIIGLISGERLKLKIVISTVIMFVVEIFIIFLAIIFQYFPLIVLILIGISVAVAAMYTLYLYNTLKDFFVITEYITYMHKGTLNVPLTLDKTSELYLISLQLNDLQSAIRKTVDNLIKSERMKIELITNVSHDLKTPLTSIVSYTQLLSDMELTPPEANDYVRIVANKSDRLRRLTSDLFDISKAESGEMRLNIERLDMGEHLHQTLAELHEKIKDTELEFKINIPTEAVYIHADGEKLYRIFENLIVNAIKYAMSGTRVYVTLKSMDNKAVFEIKNIASYEMTFDSNEITERFTRGDEARSEEGSGLGLAICKSFAQSFGGAFRVDIDGDLFKAIVSFPLCSGEN